MRYLDSVDRAILRILQKDNIISHRDIGAVLHVSPTAVTTRIRRMSEEGTIVANVAQIAPEAVGLALTIFVELEITGNTVESIDRAKTSFRGYSEVQQCYYVTGGVDFIVVLVVESMAAYEEFTRREVFKTGAVRVVRTFISMDGVKRNSSVLIKD